MHVKVTRKPKNTLAVFALKIALTVGVACFNTGRHL